MAMRTLFFLILGLPLGVFSQDHLTPYEKSAETATATYFECRDWYRSLQKSYPDITYFDSIGYSDGGLPVYVFRLYTNENPFAVRVLINNNIHPGEPEGTDASMLMVRDFLKDQKKWKQVLKNIDLHIICQYNVDGTLNQSCCTRANQNGPELLGFRGNAKNLDLNRDFIKCDSRNARAFVNYFSGNKFQIFIDNHTSNGADYQYTLTWFYTREEKLHPELRPLLQKLSDGVGNDLLKCGIPTAPYVVTHREVPDSGLEAFWETGRFATGYAALKHCIGYTVETHMWKPFPARVKATRAFMETLLLQAADNKNSEELNRVYRSIDFQNRLSGNRVEYTNWTLNTEKCDSILFLGYEHGYKTSRLSGLPRLYYDTTKPWSKKVPYYHYYEPTDSVLMPRMYWIPQAWQDVIARLKWNGIEVKSLGKDTIMNLRVSYVTTYETTKTAYEGHYLHYNTVSADTVMPVQLRRGDHYILVSNANRAFLAATLEPRSPDSYFNWNFFDAVLQQKEWYSDYVFEEKALELLAADPELKKAFEKEKEEDASFAGNHQAQLSWIYYHSAFYEKSHKRLPVYRFD